VSTWRWNSVLPRISGDGKWLHAPIIPLLYDVSAMPITSGPYLSAAFLCEKVLREADGVFSFIRVVDKWTVTGTTQTMLPTVIQANLVVLLKSGIHRGSSQITITPTTPSGVLMPAIEVPLIFEGDDDHGSGFNAPIGFPAQESGLYWFDVSLDGQAITKIPLRVAYLRIPQAPGQPTQAI
jgi:hypothetical protein